MSRVGRSPVPLPGAVRVEIDGQTVAVSGPKGALAWEIPAVVRVSVSEGALVVTRTSDARAVRAKHGLTRALLYNMVVGVSEGFTKTLEIQGTGYRAEMDGNALVLRVGFSHPVRVEPRAGLEIQVEGPLVHVRGIDKQAVGQQAAEIRRIRPPEPYKGKGIRYRGEWVRRKAGKSGAK